MSKYSKVVKDEVKKRYALGEIVSHSYIKDLFNKRKRNARLNFNLTLKEYNNLTKACKICGFSEVVDLHHIDKNKKNNKKNNLIGLCPNHHMMVHRLGKTLEELK